MFQVAERNRLSKSLGIGAGIHILLLLILLLIPLSPKEDKIPMGAIRVELGSGMENLSGEKRPTSPTPKVETPTQTKESSSPVSKAPSNPREEPSTPDSSVSKPIPPSSSPATGAKETVAVNENTPSAPKPVNKGLSGTSTAPAAPQTLAGLEGLDNLFSEPSTSSGQSTAPGKTKFEAGAGNTVELDAEGIFTRPEVLLPPIFPPGTASGDLEVRFVTSEKGLVKISPETLIMKGLSGHIANTPENSQEWIELRKEVEKTLGRWTFLPGGREIRGRVVFTIKNK